MTDIDRAKQMSGRIMLCGVIALFLGLILCLAGLALQFGSNNPMGGTLISIGEILLGSWLILLFAGIAARVSLSDDSETSQEAPKDDQPSA